MASLVVGERPAPVARPGWVPVTVGAASLNMHDVWTLRGVGIAPDRFPMILGCDGAGILADGTEVVIHSIVNAPDWRGDETLDPQRTLLTEIHQGTFADVVMVPEGNAVAKPPGLSTVHAAVMGTRMAHGLPHALRQVRTAARPTDARPGCLGRSLDRADPAGPSRRA